MALKMDKLVAIRLMLMPLLLWSGCSFATAEGAPYLNNIRLGVDGERTRIVIDLSEQVKFSYFTLSDPYRVVVDLPALDWPKKLKQPAWRGLVKNLRYGLFSSDTFRLVFDASAPVSVTKIFTLPPSAGFDHRLVIDLAPTSDTAFEATIEARRADQPVQAQQPTADIRQPTAPKQKARPVVVIDPGHGGVDPGTHGQKVLEKEVVLAFARELAASLKATGRYEVYLTRDRDIYIPLRERVSIARRKEADLFISIHADAISRKKVRGMSIYTLSETASDKEAAALARKENRSDIIAGMDFGDQPAEVTNILIDLAQRETKNLSVKFANTVVNEMQGKTTLLDRTHRFAGFRVLKAPDVPSVLIELGFLTNKSDEKLLVSSKWRKNVATGLQQAIDQYFRQLRELTAN